MKTVRRLCCDAALFECKNLKSKNVEQKWMNPIYGEIHVNVFIKNRKIGEKVC